MTAERSRKIGTKGRASAPTFPVYVRQSIGEVFIDGYGDTPAAVAAFALIDSHVARDGQDAAFTFTLPGGPTYNVGATFGGGS